MCDDQRRIRYIYTGWPGCSHDARVFENSALAQEKDEFFSGEEYLLADSGYTASMNVVPAFKRTSHRNLTPEENEFNELLSKARVKVEHCIGIFKGRFQSLRGLRILIRRDKDVKRAVYWIRACVVLHNLLLQDPVEEEWLEKKGDDNDDDNNDDNEGDLGGASNSAGVNNAPGARRINDGKRKRTELMTIVLSKYDLS